MKKAKLVATLTMTLALLIAGCKKNEAGAPQYTAIDNATAATITGAIHFTGAAPKPVAIDMSQDPACTLGPANMTEGYAVNNGSLGNVFVYVKDGLGNKVYAAPTQPVVIDQKGCRYVPHVVGVMVGQPVQFINSDPTMHNIHMTPTVGGNQAVDISQPPSSGQNSPHDQATFAKPELMIPVRCNNHPWMQAFINVSPNPFYAVSDASGKYTIHGLPPGTYTLVAAQENLGQQTATVTVTAQQTATQDFTFTK